MRLLVGLAFRVLLLASAAYGLVGCRSWVEEQYQDSLAYTNASVCPAGQTSDTCIERTAAQVVNKSQGTFYFSTENSGGGSAPTYDVAVRHSRGAEWLGVRSETYSDVDLGDSVELRLWDGTVVEMKAGGHTQTYGLPSRSSLLWGLATTWIVLGLAVTALVAYGEFTGLFFITWLLLSPTAVATAYGVLAAPQSIGPWLMIGCAGVTGLGLAGAFLWDSRRLF
ncbi:hypothetical protein [Streptomyces sp. NPDC002324]